MATGDTPLFPGQQQQHPQHQQQQQAEWSVAADWLWSAREPWADWLHEGTGTGAGGFAGAHFGAGAGVGLGAGAGFAQAAAQGQGIVFTSRSLQDHAASEDMTGMGESLGPFAQHSQSARLAGLAGLAGLGEPLGDVPWGLCFEEEEPVERDTQLLPAWSEATKPGLPHMPEGTKSGPPHVPEGTKSGLLLTSEAADTTLQCPSGRDFPYPPSNTKEVSGPPAVPSVGGGLPKTIPAAASTPVDDAAPGPAPGYAPAPATAPALAPATAPAPASSFAPALPPAPVAASAAALSSSGNPWQSPSAELPIEPVPPARAHSISGVAAPDPALGLTYAAQQECAPLQPRALLSGSPGLSSDDPASGAHSSQGFARIPSATTQEHLSGGASPAGASSQEVCSVSSLGRGAESRTRVASDSRGHTSTSPSPSSNAGLTPHWTSTVAKVLKQMESAKRTGQKAVALPPPLEKHVQSPARRIESPSSSLASQGGAVSGLVARSPRSDSEMVRGESLRVPSPHSDCEVVGGNGEGRVMMEGVASPAGGSEDMPCQKQRRLIAGALKEALEGGVNGRPQSRADAQGRAQEGAQGAQGAQGNSPSVRQGNSTAGDQGSAEMHLVEVGLHLMQRGFLAIDLDSILGGSHKPSNGSRRQLASTDQSGAHEEGSFPASSLSQTRDTQRQELQTCVPSDASHNSHPSRNSQTGQAGMRPQRATSSSLSSSSALSTSVHASPAGLPGACLWTKQQPQAEGRALSVRLAEALQRIQAPPGHTPGVIPGSTAGNSPGNVPGNAHSNAPGSTTGYRPGKTTRDGQGHTKGCTPKNAPGKTLDPTPATLRTRLSLVLAQSSGGAPTMGLAAAPSPGALDSLFAPFGGPSAAAPAARPQVLLGKREPHSPDWEGGSLTDLVWKSRQGVEWAQGGHAGRWGGGDQGVQLGTQEQRLGVGSGPGSGLGLGVGTESPRLLPLTVSRDDPVHGLTDAFLSQENQQMIKHRLFLAAQAVDQGNLGLFNALVGYLRQFSNRRGMYAQRCVHLMLDALLMRIRNKGSYAINTAPRKITVQELGFARIWVFKETPFISWAGMFATSMILPSLIGRRAVHIVCWSDCYVQQLVVLLRLLASHSTPGAPPGAGAAADAGAGAGGGRGGGVGAPWGRLESFRVTMLDPHMLSTKRSDILSVKVWGAVRAALQKEGSELGVKLEFRVLFLEPGNLQVLDTVQPVENEAVAVCCLMGLQRSSASPEAGGGARARIMERLKPSILAFAEENMDASSDVFLERFKGILNHYWDALRSLDCCYRHRNVKPMLAFEQYWYYLNTYAVVSCEGSERVVRPLSARGWHAWFTSCGFKEVPARPSVLKHLDRFVSNYPSEFETYLEGNVAWIGCHGRPLMFASCWK